MTLDPAYRSVVQQIVNSAPMNSRRDPLPPGTHEVAICRYQAVAGQMNTGYRLESTFLILSSDQQNIPPGTIRDWTWFPNAQGFRGGYEADRAHSFLSLGREGLGTAEPDDQVGDKLATGEYRGMRWRVTVTQVYNQDGSMMMTQPRNGRGKPKPIRNAEFFPVAQTPSDLAQMKAYLETNFASACRNVEIRQQGAQGAYPAQYQQAPHPAQMAAQYPAQTQQYAQQPQQYGQPPHGGAPGVQPQQYAQQPAQMQPAPNPYAQPAAGLPQHPQQHLMGAGYPPAQQQQQQQHVSGQVPWQQQAPAQPAFVPQPQGPQAAPQQQPMFAQPAAQPQVQQQPVFAQHPQGPQFQAPQGPQVAPQPGLPLAGAPALAALGPMMNQLRQQ